MHADHVLSSRKGQPPDHRGETPITPSVTGAEHRVRIDFPESFEFRLAEIGSGTSKTTGAIELDLKATYGQFAHIHLGNKGRLD